MSTTADLAAKSSPVLVRPATPGDAARIADLSGQLGYPTTSEEAAERLRQLTADPRHVVYVAALADGRVIGWIQASARHTIESGMQVEIAGLVIDAAYRGSGAGRRLMEQAERWACQQGCRTVVLRSNVIRAGAHGFYERLGYQLIKTQKVFRKEL